jgi:SAM-dependent methyltransferase
VALQWSSYASAYDRVLCKTATYQTLISDLVGRTGPLAPLRDGVVILDCGCGTGNLCQSIADQFPAATVVAVDSDPAMVKHFREKLAERLSPVPQPGRVFLLEGDVTAVFPLLAQHGLRPDYAFLVNVLYLLADPEATLQAIRDCLSPHGELRLSNPDERTDLDALFRQLKRDLADAGQLDEFADDIAVLETFNRQHLSSALHRLSAAETSELVLGSGFREIAHVTHDHYAGQSLLLSATV